MNVGRIVTDVQSNLKMLWRNKGSIFWMLAFPILLMVIFGSIFSAGTDVTLSLHVLDEDQSPLSESFVEALNSTGAFEMHFLEQGADVDKEIQDQEIRRLLIIPEGFNDEFYLTGEATMTLRLDESEQQTSAAASQIVRAVIYEFNMAFANSSREVSVVEGGLTIDDEFEYIDFFLPGVIGMTVMTSGIYGAIAVNTRYRKNGILRKMATTPMTKAEWVLAKITYQIFVAFLSMAALIVVAVLAYGVNVHINALVILLVVTASMAFSGIGMIVARFVKDEEAAESAGAAINFPMMFLSGIFFPLEMMPALLQAIGKVMPLYYVGEGLRDAMIDNNLSAAFGSAVLIFVLGVAIVAIGSLVSSWTDE